MAAWSFEQENAAASPMRTPPSSKGRDQTASECLSSAKAVSIRSRNSASFSPPTGCLTIKSLGSAFRAFACARTSGRKVSVMTM